MSGGSSRSALTKRSNRRSTRAGSKAVADRRVGRRAAALAQDGARAREAYDVVHGQEVGCVAEPVDQRELVVEGRLDRARHAAGIACRRADPGQMGELLLGAAAGVGQLLGVFVAELVETEAAAFGDLEGARDRPGVVPEQARHLGRALEVALGVDLEPEAGLIDGAMLAHATQRVQERPARGRVQAHVVAGDQRGAAGRGQVVQIAERTRVAAAVEDLPGQIAGSGEAPAQARQGRAEPRAQRVRFVGRQHDQHLAFAVVLQLRQGEPAIALLGAPLAQGQQAAQPAVGGAVGRVAEHLRPILGRQPGADQQLEPGLLGGDMGAHHARPDGSRRAGRNSCW
jgi:hypothetical protein